MWDARWAWRAPSSDVFGEGRSRGSDVDHGDGADAPSGRTVIARLGRGFPAKVGARVKFGARVARKITTAGCKRSLASARAGGGRLADVAVIGLALPASGVALKT